MQIVGPVDGTLETNQSDDTGIIQSR